MYKDIDIKKLPTRGAYYKDDIFIKVRAFSVFEIASMKSMNTKTFMSQLRKLEFAMLSVDTNMDELDLCYTDVYYLYYTAYGLTYHEIKVKHGGMEILCPINPDHFLFSFPEFSKKEDMYYDEKDIKFYHPSLYNMSKANSNIIKSAVKGVEIINDTAMLERMALVPYLQEGKISDNALDFVNEHMMTFSDEDIQDMRKFINSKENMVLGQKLSIQEDGEEKELLISLSQLV